MMASRGFFAIGVIMAVDCLCTTACFYDWTVPEGSGGGGRGGSGGGSGGATTAVSTTASTGGCSATGDCAACTACVIVHHDPWDESDCARYDKCLTMCGSACEACKAEPGYEIRLELDPTCSGVCGGIPPCADTF